MAMLALRDSAQGASRDDLVCARLDHGDRYAPSDDQAAIRRSTSSSPDTGLIFLPSWMWPIK